MDAPGFAVSMDNGTKCEATMTLKSLAALEINTAPPARNFLSSRYVNVKSLRDNKNEPVFETRTDDAVAQQPSA